MSSDKEENIEENIKILNNILKEKNLFGNVQYIKDSYWYLNAASHGFLGKTGKEARSSLITLIESVQAVQDAAQSSENKSFFYKLKKWLS